eukprot:g12806.t1
MPQGFVFNLVGVLFWALWAFLLCRQIWVVLRRVHFSAQVTVSCIEKVQELDCSTGDTRKPFGRRTLARLRSLLSIFGCLHVRLRPAEPCLVEDDLRHEVPLNRNARLRTQSTPAIEVCWDTFINQAA